MSENKPKADRRYIAKVKETQGQYGPIRQILMDNINPTNADGSVNPYYNGSLIFIDKDGRQFLVKQLNLGIPRNGFHPNIAQKGFVEQVSINLSDSYAVTPLDPTE